MIVAVDDEKIALEGLMDILHEIQPDTEIVGFRKGEEALKYLAEHPCEVVFLDIQMRGMNGIALAKGIKILHPMTNIIFTTGYAEYMGEAFSLHASGYIMKPITSEKVRMELDNLRHPIAFEPMEELRVMTFGNFEVFVGQNPVKFQYSKTKELLAYLIDRNGAMCTLGEIIATLWEDDATAQSRISYVKNLRRDLLSTLGQYGYEDVIVKKRGELGIIPNRIKCDYYDFKAGLPQGLNAYHGEYMEQYSWSEFTHAELEMKINKE